jgi:CheY-like chemotaxis protein
MSESPTAPLGDNSLPKARPHLRATSARYGASPIRGKRILYVDDEPLFRQATNRVLRRAGAICLLAGTHDQAVALVGGEPELALAILDFHMPDGYVGQLVKRLRRARPSLPLIGTSGAERRTEFAQHGVTQFLEKPWQLGDLVRAVELVSASNPRRQGVESPDPCVSAHSRRGY